MQERERVEIVPETYSATGLAHLYIFLSFFLFLDLLV
jgi:hypothetical protein